MLKARIFDFGLFFTALALAVTAGFQGLEISIYVKALFLYLLFSSLYSQFRITDKKNDNLHIEYGISYSLSFGIFAGPLGLFVYETIYRFIVTYIKKKTKTADPGEFLDTFYNIGSFTVANSIAFYLFSFYIARFEAIPFGYWILMLILTYLAFFLSSTFLSTVFLILGEIRTLNEAIRYVLTRAAPLDILKTFITNGLMLLLLQKEEWGMLISLFLLNYLVSRSFYSKSQSIKTKVERDKFEQMAYTDFLTGVNNRTFMDKKISELNQTSEVIGIVVADIDKFKRINDKYYHAAGDVVIQHFANSLKSFLNQQDFLFRTGGEEFTIFFRNRSYEETKELVEKMRETIEKSSAAVEFKGKQISVPYTASFGLYYFKIDEGIPVEKGYHMADQLLFKSKELGRNLVTAECGQT